MAKSLGLTKWMRGWNDLYKFPEKNTNSVGKIVSKCSNDYRTYYGIDLGNVEVIIGYKFDGSEEIPFIKVRSNIFEEDFLL